MSVHFFANEAKRNESTPNLPVGSKPSNHQDQYQPIIPRIGELAILSSPSKFNTLNFLIRPSDEARK